MESDQGFRRFYEMNFPAVYRAAFGLAGNQYEAEEATQEAFSRSWKHWNRLGRQDWAAGWVMTTALNLVRRTRRLVIQASTSRSASIDSDAAIDLWSAIRGLPRREQEAVLLFYMADLPVSSVAQAMRCKEGTVKAHLSSARQKLAQFLKERDSFG